MRIVKPIKIVPGTTQMHDLGYCVSFRLAILSKWITVPQTWSGEGLGSLRARTLLA